MRRTFGAVALLSVAAVFMTGCMLPAPFRVMSFNIRYAAADDGPNAWELRRTQVVETIRSYGPAVVGLQEVLAAQAEELCAALPEYGFVGVGRDDGALKGEFVPILYRRERFTLLHAGHFWLSENPERVGSVGWDAALPRLATWVRLRCKDAPLHEIQVVNVHFDHQGKRARVESAKLIGRLVESLGGRPLIVVGDFNCPPGSKPYRILTEGRKGLYALSDAHAACLAAGTAAGTFHGFTGTPRGGRIDWILMNRRLAPLAADIDHRHCGARYPSDHFPVTATLRLRAATAGFM